MKMNKEELLYEITSLKQVNKEHQELNGKLREEINRLEKQNEFLMERDNKCQILEQEKENLIKYLENEIKYYGSIITQLHEKDIIPRRICKTFINNNLRERITYKEILEMVKNG